MVPTPCTCTSIMIIIITVVKLNVHYYQDAGDSRFNHRVQWAAVIVPPKFLQTTMCHIKSMMCSTSHSIPKAMDSKGQLYVLCNMLRFSKLILWSTGYFLCFVAYEILFRIKMHVKITEKDCSTVVIHL